MDKYAGHVVGKVGDKRLPVSAKTGNKPAIPSPGSGNRFADNVFGNSKYTGKDGYTQTVGKNKASEY